MADKRKNPPLPFRERDGVRIEARITPHPTLSSLGRGSKTKAPFSLSGRRDRDEGK